MESRCCMKIKKCQRHFFILSQSTQKLPDLLRRQECVDAFVKRCRHLQFAVVAGADIAVSVEGFVQRCVQGGGCILNTSSMVSICGQPSGVAYPSSKYAVNGLTWSLARELGPFHIRVNAVAPGITRTDMVAALPKEMIEPLVNRIPLRRIGEAEDIANAFLFLASDMASYVTGEILSVDGAIRN